MLCPPHPPAPLVQNWLERHRDPRSLVLHLIGIPSTVMALLLLPVFLATLSFRIFFLSLACFAGGYLIQFLGHALDRTVPGEWVVLRRVLVRRFPALAPRLESRPA